MINKNKKLYIKKENKMETEDVGNSRQRKNKREYWNVRNSQNMRRWQVLVLYVGVFALALFLLGGYTKFKMEWIQEDGKEIATEIFSTMEKGNKLPWSSEDNKILAVIQCNGEEPIFVTEKDFLGDEVSNCTYHLAQNTKVIFASKKLKTEGIISFQPKSSE